MSDNGGRVYSKAKVSPNHPLRGGKLDLYEGGTRVVGYIQGPGILKNMEFDGLMHMVDWLPTLVQMAGGKTNNEIDGLSIMKALQKGGQTSS